MTMPSSTDLTGWLEAAQRAVHDVLEDHWPQSKCDVETAATIRGLAVAVGHLISAVHTAGNQGAAAAPLLHEQDPRAVALSAAAIVCSQGAGANATYSRAATPRDVLEHAAAYLDWLTQDHRAPVA